MPKKKIRNDAELINELNDIDLKDSNQTNCIVSTYYIFNQPHLDELGKQANNLYNESLWRLIHDDKVWNYPQLNKCFKKMYEDEACMLYRKMDNVKNAQNVMKLAAQDMSNYRASLKAYRKHPKKFSGKPRRPHYSKKHTRHTFAVSNQTIKNRNGYLYSKKMGVNIKLDPAYCHYKLVRTIFVPIHGGYKVCAVFHVNKRNFQPDNGIYIGIDPGIDNAFVCVCNKKQEPLIINGKSLKSVNQYYHKKKAHLQRQQAQYNQNSKVINTKQGKKTIYLPTNRMKKLDFDHARKEDLFIYKSIKEMTDYALACNAKTIFIGKNKNWKKNVKMGKKNNQNFLGIPHAKIINKLKAKAALYGIRVIATNESYTSQTSFLDGEKPCNANGNAQRKNKGLSPVNRRIHRGLFKSNKGILINADVNGALQIIKKGFTTWQKVAHKNKLQAFSKLSFDEGIEGVVLHPVKINCLI